MNPVHETLEIVGMDDRMGAIVPAAASRASVGACPRAIRSCTSGSPTPSSPMTATCCAAGACRSSRAGRFSSVAPPPRRSRSSHPTPLHLLLRDPDDLGDRRDARAYAAPAVVAQRPHALLHRRVLDLARRPTLEDQLLDGVAHGQELVDARAAAVAGLGAVLAALALDRAHVVAIAAHLAQHLDAQLRRLLALRADLAHEALRQ